MSKGTLKGCLTASFSIFNCDIFCDFKNPKKILIAILSLVIIISCSSTKASYSANKPSRSSGTKSKFPKVPPKQVPGGIGDNWRYLGLTSDKLIAIEINESSIKNNGLSTNFQDRKTIIEPKKFNYKTTPEYKYSLSWWQIDCSKQLYSINSTSIYDLYGNLIKSYSFGKQNIASSAIPQDSIANEQYQYICKGINRGLGY